MIKVTGDQKKKLAGIAIATLVVAVAIWYFLIANQKATLVDVRQKAEGAYDKATKAEKEVKNAQQVDELLQSRIEQVRNIEETMASGDLFFWSVTTVNNLLTRHRGVSIPKFTKPTEGDVGLLPNFPYRAATFNVEGTAHYEELGKFLADFENEFPYMRAQNLELNPIAANTQSEADKGSEKLGFKMDIVALIKPATSR